MKKILGLAAGVLILLEIYSSYALVQQNNECSGTLVLAEFSFLDGKIEMINKSIINGCSPNLKQDDSLDYKYRLVNRSFEEVFSASFNPDTLFVDRSGLDGELEGGATQVSLGDFFLALPYSKEVENIQIYKRDEKIFEAKISDAGASLCRIK